ncbi:hypothetical protein J6590_090887 [Homalodisca vitripennis]|nr:hypothetical protein J6590_090887 [Homalodisca vitripennis]
MSGSLSRSTDKLSTTMVNTRSNSCSSQDEYNKLSVDEKLNLWIDEVRRIKDCENSVGVNSKKITECETLIDSLRSEKIALKESVVGLKRRVAAGEQYSRSNCLEITGVPEARNEDIFEVVKRVAKA